MLEYGIPFLLLDMHLPEKRLDYMIRNSCIKKIITIRSCIKNVIKDIEYIILDEIDILDVQNTILEEKEENEIAYIIYTSGTTGNPKGVQVTRTGLINFILGISEAISFEEESVIICLSSVTFDIFFLETVFAMIKGFTVVMVPENEYSNPAKIKELILEHNVNTIQMTPSRMKWFQLYDPTLSFLSGVKVIMIGGEIFPQSLLEILQNNTNAQIYNMYGPTETTIWSTISDLTHAKKVDIGQPIKDTQIYILDENLCEVEDGKEGEIYIAGKGVASGYINDEEQTNARFLIMGKEISNKIYKTGDIGKYENGKLLCLGRNDNQVKCRGYRIELDEIDYRLTAMKDVKYVVTHCQKNEEKEELIVFYVADKMVECEKFIAFLNNYLPEYMIPLRYIRVPFLEYTESGKVDKRRMEEKYLINKEKQKKHVMFEEDGITPKVIQIVEKILSRSVGDELDREFDCFGMDSISFIKIVVQVEETFNFEFETEKLTQYNFYTIRDFIHYVHSRIRRYKD